jgi:hypothetical protein
MLQQAHNFVDDKISKEQPAWRELQIPLGRASRREMLISLDSSNSKPRHRPGLFSFARG